MYSAGESSNSVGASSLSGDESFDSHPEALNSELERPAQASIRLILFLKDRFRDR